MQELTCALKPRLLRFLLGEGADAVVYVDSDTDIHGSLDHVGAVGRAGAASPSRRTCSHQHRSTMFAQRVAIAKVGMYNSGLIAVGASGAEFLDWWASRLRWDCLFAEPVGTHADQRWLDWVPLYFRHAVVRDPGLNVAHWNLHERRLVFADDRFTVNGEPLRSFHFAGFDPLRPERVSQYFWLPYFRIDLDDGALARLCWQNARTSCSSAGHEQGRKTPYRYNQSAAGTGLGEWERRVYREALLAAHARGRDDVPSPFDPARSTEFERLLTHPRSAGLFSETALTRLADSRTDIHGGGWNLRRIRDTVQSRLARGLRGPRPPWMPHPLPGDSTLAEYRHSGR